MTRIFIAVLALLLLIPPHADAGNDLNIGKVYCNIPYTVNDAAVNYFDFACRLRLNSNDTATVLLINEAGASLAGKVPPQPDGQYVAQSASGFPCIINGQPAGRGTCCTTDTSVSIRADGKINFMCKCKLQDPSKSCEIADLSQVTPTSCQAACKP